MSCKPSRAIYQYQRHGQGYLAESVGMNIWMIGLLFLLFGLPVSMFFLLHFVYAEFTFKEYTWKAIRPCIWDYVAYLWLVPISIVVMSPLFIAMGSYLLFIGIKDTAIKLLHGEKINWLQK